MAPTFSGTGKMQIDVSEILRTALAQGATEAGLQAHVERVCRHMHGGEWQQAAESTQRMVQHHAADRGTSRLDAARELAGGTATVNVVRYEGDDMPPEMQSLIDQMRASGKLPADGEAPLTRRVVRRTFVNGKEVPPADFDAAGLPPAVGRGRSIVKAALLLLVLLAIGVGVPVLRTWWRVRDRGGSKIGDRVQRLEARHAKSPGDIELAVQLGEGYARLAVLSRSLRVLKQHRLGVVTADGVDLDKEWAETTARMQSALGLTGADDESASAARKGEALMRGLLADGSLSAAQELTCRILLGHFLVALGDTAGARGQSDLAAALDGLDPRPHLLNARICEEERDYDTAINENQAALAGLSAWVNRDATLLQHVGWAVSGTAAGGEFSRERAWQRRKAAIAKDVRDGINLHITVLRAQAKAEAMLERK